MKNYLQKIRKLTATHKKTSITVALVVVILGYYLFQKYSGETSTTNYVLASVSKGTLVTSLSGTGQVSASNQVDIKSKVSGAVTYVGLSSGAEALAGSIVIIIDSSDAEKTVRDAQANLESAQISYQKTVKPADELSLIQAENSLEQAKNTYIQAHDDGYTAVSNAYLDLPSVVADTYDVLYSKNTTDPSQQNVYAYADRVKEQFPEVITLRDKAINSFNSARTAHDAGFLLYRSTERTADDEVIEDLVLDTYEKTKTVASAIKNISDYFSYTKDKLASLGRTSPTDLAMNLDSISGYLNIVNNHLSSTLSKKQAIVNATYSLQEKTQSLTDLKAGADELDIASAKLSLTQKENALLDAKANLADYYIRMPFGGKLAKINVKKGDEVSNGTELASVITNKRQAEISLNEVDISKVKAGQKATLTFDAIEDLVVAGTVSDVDSIGTVSQGVVTYAVNIVFDTNDERIRPGMSTSAAIITEVISDTLLVPNSAIKSSGVNSYVEMFNDTMNMSTTTEGVSSEIAPTRVTVTIGNSNDEYTQIISGLKEGDLVVERTVAASKSVTSAPSATSLLGGQRTSGTGTTRALTR